MRTDSRISIDPDIIHIDLSKRKASFNYLKKPTIYHYLAQLLSMVFPILIVWYISSAIVILILNAFLWGPTFLSLPNHPALTLSLEFVLLYPIALILYIIIVDFYFKTKITSVFHNFFFDFFIKIEKSFPFEKQIIFIHAKSQGEEIIISSPQYGFIWTATGEHRKYLSDIRFIHEDKADIPIKEEKIKFWFLRLHRIIPHKAIIKFYFDSIPKTGSIKLNVY